MLTPTDTYIFIGGVICAIALAIYLISNYDKEK